MAIALNRLREYLEELRTVYEDAVFYEKSDKELTALLEQIKHIQRVIVDIQSEPDRKQEVNSRH